MNKLMGMVAAVALLTNCDNPQSADVNMSEADLKVESGVTLTNMDLTVNPGDDFFEYVNGTWLENTDIPSDKRRYGSFDVLRDNAQTDVRAIIEEASSAGAEFGSNQQKVGDLYKSYMDMDTRNALGIAPLKEGLDAINAISDLNELSAYFAVAGKYSLTTPLALYVGVDAKIPTQYSLHIYQLGLGLPDRDYYFNEDEKSKEIRDKYVVHIEKMLDLAQIENASASAQTVMDIEIKIANLHWKKEDNRDSNKRYNKYEIAELKSLLSNMDLDAYFDETGVQNVEAVVVNQPSYLEGLNGMLADIDLTAWKTYLKWSYVNDMAGRLNSDMDNQNFDFYSRTLSGVEEQRP
ncbi:MAG: peptidase M13, partial [Kordiimonadaceae bacterium]|nr:peptidase M13 [Kordiimonadaceae bacterium]